MMRHSHWLGIAVIAASIGLSRAAAAGEIKFQDVTDTLGLSSWRGYQYGHGAAWGDADGDGLPDLYIGAFASYPPYHTDNPPIPNMLFLNRTNRFEIAPEHSVRLDGRYANTSGAFFADLDNDGDLDLFVCSFTLSDSLMRKPGNRRVAQAGGPSMLFESIGGGRFAEATPLPGWPFNLSARNATALDLDNDGLLDLIILDGHYLRWNDVDLTILHNKGHLEFADISATPNVPHGGLRGLGLAIGDINEDGRMDLFIAHANRLLLNTSTGGPTGTVGFVDWQKGSFPAATWKNDGDAWPCGAAFGDLNGDGLLDLVYTVHTVPGRLYVFMNETKDPSKPLLVDRTKEAGLDRLFPQVKIATVELRDMDNDGRLDIVPGLVFTAAAGQRQPLVCRNLGNDTSGIPRFSLPPEEVTDSIQVYAAAGPVADYDRDGRLDFAMVSWTTGQGFFIFHNVTEGGHWLDVRVRGDGKQWNTLGIGSIVRAYKAGHAGNPKRLLGRYDMATGFGYASGQEAIAHLGLGPETAVDIMVSWNDEQQTRANVKTDGTLEVAFPAP
jgi:hypothetical protein